MKNVLMIIYCLITQFVISQNSKVGYLEGKIVDESSGESIPFVKISIESLSLKATSDIDGKYVFRALPYGSYTIIFKEDEYVAKTIENVTISNDQVLNLDVLLTKKTTDLKEVKIVHHSNKGGEKELIDLRANKANQLETMSTAYIQKTGANNVGQLLTKGTGMSVQDNKFVVIRGLNDRYNAAFLNDGPLPSSESDRKAFSFDIFPANMLENLIVIKTATPDLPAEFAGGIIQINTKGIPAKNFQSILVGGGYNTITTGKERVTYKGGKTDWIGIDDGTRSLSSTIPSKADFSISIKDQAGYAQQFSTDWSMQKTTFMPNLNLQYAIGINDSLFGKEFGFMGSLSYNRTNNYNQTIRRSYSGNGSEGHSGSEIQFDLLDKIYSTQLLAGGMANFTLKLNNRNKLSFKNLYSINSDDRVISRSGEIEPLQTNPFLIKSNALWFTSNKMYSGQLAGDHGFKNHKLKLNWVGSYSNINRTIPNLRRSIYTRLKYINDPSDPVATDTVYTANIASSNVGPAYGGGMFFSTNKEQIASLKADLKYDLEKFFGIKTEIKIGALVQQRKRDFDARQLGYTKYGGAGSTIQFKDSLLYLDENTIFSPENMGLIKPGVGGFKLQDGSKYTDAYSASSSTTAGYLMLDNKIHKKFRLVWGARAEYFVQNLNAVKADKSKLELITKKLDVLPSLNAIYNLNKKHSFRFSSSQTLNRPEYRELAPFAFYDFNTQFVVSGNDSLKRAKITNFDLRYEMFLKKSQLISGTVFYKKFENPIEQISRADVSNEVTFKNVPTALNYGFEIELKLIPGEIFKCDSASFLKNISFNSNLAIIRSVVDVSNIIGTPYKERPLQGQSPYVFNAGLTYEFDRIKLNVTTNINRVGDRISILGNVNQPDIWEKGRTFLDFQLAKTFFKKKLEVRMNLQNSLAQKQIFYQNNYFSANDNTKGQNFLNSILVGNKKNDNSYNEKRDDLIWSTIYGRTISATISYKF